MGRYFLVLGILGILGGVACNRVPDVPRLDRLRPMGTQKLLLGQVLSSSDFRALFDALNEDGKLEGLRPYFQEATATLVSRYVYEDALDKNGLISLLEKRIRDRAFTRALEKWEQDPKSVAAVSSVARDFLFSEEGPYLATGAAGFFDPQWKRLLDDLRIRTAGEKVEASETGKAIDLKTDLARFLESDAAQNLPELANTLFKNHFDLGLIGALRKIREKSGPEGVLSLGNGLRELSSPSAVPLQQVLSAIREADGPSDGLFIELQKAMKDSGMLSLLPSFLEPLVVTSFVGYARELLDADELLQKRSQWVRVGSRNTLHNAGEEFRRLFLVFQTAVERVSQDMPSQVDFVSSYPYRMTAYVLSRWVEFAMSCNGQAESWQANMRSPWDLPVQVPAYRLDLHADRAIWEKDLTALGLGDFADSLSQHLARGDISGTVYDLPEISPGTRFEDALQRVVKSVHQTRPFSSPVHLINQIAFLLTRPRDSQSFTIASLESPNLLGFFLSKLDRPFEELKQLKQLFLGNGRQAAGVSPEAALSEFFRMAFSERPELADRMDLLLAGTAAIGSARSASPENLHTLLRSSGPNSIRALLAWVARSELLKVDITETEEQPLYPALWESIKSSGEKSRWFLALSSVRPEETLRLVAPVHEFLRPGPSEQVERGIRFLRGHAGTEFQLSGAGVSSDESLWLMRLLRDPELLPVWLDLKTAPPGTGKMASQLRQLRANGQLKRALRLLGQVQNDRIRRIAEVLSAWETSGELEPAVALLEHLAR